MRRLFFALLALLALNGVAAAQCVGGISNCPSATTVNPTDYTILSQPLATAPTGFTTRKTTVQSLLNSLVSNGTVISLPTTGALGSTVISPAVTGVIVQAMATSGISTCELLYVKGTTVATGQYQEIFNVPSKIYWEPQFDNSPVRACEFGTVSDGAWTNFTGGVYTNTMTGTDNQPLIQTALDYAIRNNYSTVCLNEGNYVINDALNVGYGVGVNSIQLVSCNTGRGPQNALPGVTLLVTKTDRCGMYLQGGRNTMIRGISMIGKNYAYMNNTLINSPFPTVDTGWLDPALVPGGGTTGGLQRFTPYAAICVGALNGTAPTPAYPPVFYPSWLGVGIGQYNKAPNSNISIRDIQIIGFALGIVQSPNSPLGDGNDDFLKIDDFDCQYTVYCLSIGGSQSRLPELNRFNTNLVYTGVTNVINGTLSGEMGGPITNVAMGYTYQLFRMSNGLSWSPLIENLYSESSVRLGTLQSASSAGNDFLIKGCIINGGEFNSNIIPASLIDVTGTPTNISLEGCTFTGGSRLTNLIQGTSGQSLLLNGNTFQMSQLLGAQFNSVPIQTASNYFGTMVPGNFSIFPGIGQNFLTVLNQIKGNVMPTPSSVANGSLMMGNIINNVAGGRSTYNYYANGFIDQNSNGKWLFGVGLTGTNVAISGLSPTFSVCSPSTGVDATMSFSGYANSLQNNPTNQQSSILLGDTIVHQNSGTMFVVTGITQPGGGSNPWSFTTQQMNNMTIVPGFIQALGSFNAGSGYTPGTYNNVPLGTTIGTFGAVPALVNITVNGSGNVSAVTLVAGQGGQNYVVGNAYGVNNATLGGGTGFATFISTTISPCRANLLSDQTLAGNNAVIHSGANVQVPSLIWYGDFTSGSTQVYNIHRGDTFSGNFTVASCFGPIATGYLCPGDSLRTYGNQGPDLALPIPYPPGEFLSLTPSGVITSGTITNGGTLYNGGGTNTFNGVTLTGGLGNVAATANITVTAGVVTAVVIVSGGQNYALNNALSAPASALGNNGGSGFVFTVNTVSMGNVLNSGSIVTMAAVTGGSGCTTPGTYTSVPMTVQSGTIGVGAIASITVAGGAVTVVTITSPGMNYSATSVLTANSAFIGGGCTGFSDQVATVTALGQATLTLAATKSGRFPVFPFPLFGVSGKTPNSITFSNGSVAVPQSSTVFAGPAFSSATEAQTQVPCPVAGQFSNLRVAISPTATANVAATLRVAGVSTALTCTGTSSCSDLNGNHTVSCTAGQLYDLQLVTLVTGSLTAVNASVGFTPN